MFCCFVTEHSCNSDGRTELRSLNRDSIAASRGNKSKVKKTKRVTPPDKHVLRYDVLYNASVNRFLPRDAAMLT